jgi:hypothetical protein
MLLAANTKSGIGATAHAWVLENFRSVRSVNGGVCSGELFEWRRLQSAVAVADNDNSATEHSAPYDPATDKSTSQ